MKTTARIILVITVAFLLVVPALQASKPKEKTAEKSVQGTVLAATDANLIIRKGKADMSLTYDSASQKPSTLAAGTPVLIHYRDEKNKHIVTTVQVTDGNSSDSKPQAK